MTKVSQALKLLAVFVLIRCVYALALRSSLHPDEHWQGPEVSYRMVFGSTEKTWEWLETVALRSHLHPLMFAVFYRLLQLTGLDHPLLIAYGPRHVQAVLTALGDLAFYLTAKKLRGQEQAGIAVSFYLTCRFSLSVLSRTTSNAADAALTLIGLFFHIHGFPTLTALTEAVCFLIRPPSAAFWLPICGSVALKFPARVTLRCLVLSLGLIGGVCCLDRYFYGVPQGWFAAWNFLEFNIFKGIADQYGVDPWYFYLKHFPWNFLLGFPSALLGLAALPGPWLLGWLCGLASLSFCMHKELRFMSPLFAVASLGVGRLGWPAALLHAAIGVYACRWKNLGAEMVVNRLRGEVRDEESVFFLSCHQNPLRFFLHGKNVSLDWLDCSPWPVRLNYVSDNSAFSSDPIGFLSTTERGNHAMASDWLVVDASAQTSPIEFLTNVGFDVSGLPVTNNACLLNCDFDGSPSRSEDAFVLLHKTRYV